jgi:hypothetical protein
MKLDTLNLSSNCRRVLKISGQMLFVFITALVFCLCIYEFTRDKSNVALVNINAIMNRYTHSMAKSILDDQTLQNRIAIFMKKLEEELHCLAKEKKIGLLVSEAILVGGVDYSAEIEHRVYRAYEKELLHEQASQRKE